MVYLSNLGALLCFGRLNLPTILKRGRIYILSAFLFLTAFSTPSFAADDEQRIKKIEQSTVVIGGYSTTKKKFIAMGSGFVVANDYIVTNRHVTNFFTSKNYEIYAIKAQSKVRVLASVVWADKSHDVALIYAPNLGATPLQLATVNSYVTQRVALMGFPGVAETADTSNPTYTEGTITKIFVKNPNGLAIQRLQYSAESSGGSSGGAVLDMCGRALGYHSTGISDKGAKFNRGYAIKHAIEQIRRRSPSVPLSITASKCIIKNSSDQKAVNAQIQAEKALVETAKTAKILEDKLKAAAELAAAETMRYNKKINDMKKRDEKQNRMLMGVLLTVIGLAVLTFVLLILFVKKPRQAFVRSMSRMVGAPPVPVPIPSGGGGQPAATTVHRTSHNERGSSSGYQQRAAPVRDGISISGFGENGNTIRLVVGSNDAGRRGGLTFGRSADFCDRTLANSSVSKRQFQITYEGGTFFIQDLNSTNGTSVNGRFLAPYSAERLKIGDTLNVGDLQLVVSKR